MPLGTIEKISRAQDREKENRYQQRSELSRDPEEHCG